MAKKEIKSTKEQEELEIKKAKKPKMKPYSRKDRRSKDY